MDQFIYNQLMQLVEQIGSPQVVLLWAIVIFVISAILATLVNSIRRYLRWL